MSGNYSVQQKDNFCFVKMKIQILYFKLFFRPDFAITHILFLSFFIHHFIYSG